MEKKEVKNIFETISAVMGEIGAVGKDSKNQQQGFMFRGIDAVMNAINPALVKYHLFIVPEILEQTREERVNSKGTTLIYSICKIKYTFYAEDGSSISATVIGEGMDSGDKATNKAMSIAFKYAAFQVFCIPTEEMVDPDAECHEVKPKQNKASKPKEPEKAAEPQKEPTITHLQVGTIKQKAEKDGVPEELIKKLYNVENLGDLTVKKFENINQFWDKIVEKAKEGNQ
jgi:hypothetical protein